MALAILVPTRFTISASLLAVEETTLLDERKLVYSVLAMLTTSFCETKANWLRPVIAFRVHAEKPVAAKKAARTNVNFINIFFGEKAISVPNKLIGR